MSNNFAEFNISLQNLNWSQDNYNNIFQLSYNLLNRGHIIAGACEIGRNKFAGRRFIHWEASMGIIVLKEIWLDGDLVDHAICLQLGDISLGVPLSVHCETIETNNHHEIKVRLSFAMGDGSIHNVQFKSSSNSRSIFADIVDRKAGGILSSRAENLPFIHFPENSLIQTHQISDSIRDNQTITCATHLSHFGIVFGLSQGDIVYIRSASDGLYVETLLRDEWVLTSFFSGFIGTTRRPSIVSVSGSHLRDFSVLVSVSADGYLRVWDCLSRTCLQRVSVMSLIDQEITNNPSQGVVMENICLHTSPFDLLVTTSEADPSNINALGLAIGVGVTVRVGRVRSWNIFLLSWSPLKVGLPVRAYLRPIIIPQNISSSDVSLEQINLSPSQVHQTHCGCDLITTLWNIKGDIIPVSYTTNKLDWSNTGHINAIQSSSQLSSQSSSTSSSSSSITTSGYIHIDPISVPYNPAETKLAMITNDKYLLESVVGIQSRDSMIWTATGIPHNTVNLNFLSQQIMKTFFQRVFYPGRFERYELVNVLCHDIPYEFQFSRETFDQVSQINEESIDLFIGCFQEAIQGIEKDIFTNENTNYDENNEPILTKEHLEKKIQIALNILEMLEIQKSKRLSTSGSCSIIQSNRNTYRTNNNGNYSNYDSDDDNNYNNHNNNGNNELNNYNIPFHFIVVRPSSLGIVLKMEFLSHTTLLGYIKSTPAPISSAINEIFSLVSEILLSPDMLYLDSSITRYISDVVNIDIKSSSWILDKIKLLLPSQLIKGIQQVLHKYRVSDDIIKYLIELLQNDLLWGTNNFSQNNSTNHSNKGVFHGIFSTLLMKEYSKLIIRERYSFTKTLLISFLIILDICNKNETYKYELFQGVVRILYDSYLLWISSLYLTNNSILAETVDFKDVQYDSSIMRNLLNYPKIIGSSKFEQSIWVGFLTNKISHLIITPSNLRPEYTLWQNISHQLFSSFYQSCYNDIVTYLYSKEQYSLITRICSISHLLTTYIPEDIFQHISSCYEQTIISISLLQSHLSDVTNYSSIVDTNLSPELYQCVENLLSISINLNDGNNNTNHNHHHNHNHNSNNNHYNNYYDGNNIKLKKDKSFENLIPSEDTGNKNEIYSFVQSWISTKLDKEKYLSFADTIIRLSDLSSFRILFHSILNISNDPVNYLIDSYSNLFLYLYELKHRSNTLTILDRSRTLLPSSRGGDELTLLAAKVTIHSLNNLLEYLQHQLNNDNDNDHDNDDVNNNVNNLFINTINRELKLELVAVWSKVFNLSIHSLQFDKALEAVTTLLTLSNISTDSLHWRSCLRTLIFTACSTGNVVWLCSLPDSLMGIDGITYIDLTKEITVEMENLARSSDLMSLPTISNNVQNNGNINGNINASSNNSDDIAITSLGNFYDCIAAYLISKRLFMECARLHYQLYERIGNINDISSISYFRTKLQLRCLTVALSSLWCLPVNQRFFVFEKTQKNTVPITLREFEYNKLNQSKLISHVSIKDLEHNFLQIQNHLLLFNQRNQTINSLSDLDLVRSLCDQNNFIDALNFSIHSSYSANETNLLLETVIRSITSQCSINTSSSSSSSLSLSLLTSSQIQTLEEQFISLLGCVPSPLLQVNQLSSEHLWQYLLNILHKLDNSKDGLSLHQVATKSALMLSNLRENRLPNILTSSFCDIDSNSEERMNKRTKFDNNNSFNQDDKEKVGNIESLIRLYLSKGCLIDACEIVYTYLISNKQLNNSKSQCFPLHSIDQLLFSCQTAINLTSNEDDKEKLIVSYEKVKQEIKGYFTRLFLAEIHSK